MAKKGKQSAPAHRFIRLDLEHTGNGEDFHYIDIARELSAINSRLYRQGMSYHVANISIHDSQSSWTKFCTLPNTWPVRKAWQVGFQHWLNMNARLPDDVLRSASAAGKWNDFRIFFSEDHTTDDDKPKFTDVEGGKVVVDEYNYSKFFPTDGDELDPNGTYAHMLGAHKGTAGDYDSISLLEAYNESVFPSDTAEDNTNIVTGVWANLMETTAAANNTISAELDSAYDTPPYSSTRFPGTNGNCNDPWSVREVHIEGAYQNSAMIGGFEAPCGLICVETSGTANNTIGIIIEIAPGDYKGVSAEPMGTPKLVNEKEWKVS